MEDFAAPALAALRAGFGTREALAGLAPGLVVPDPRGWIPADLLAADDTGLLLAAAQRRWRTRPHVAAALMWKAYSYWLSVPAAFSWVAARRVPHLSAGQVLVRLDSVAPVRLGLRPGIGVSVLPDDPLARDPAPHVEVVPDEAALLTSLRRVLLDEHVTPVLDAFRGAVRISRRPLLGSLAAGVAHATRHAVRSVPGASPSAVGTLLGALDLADLVEVTAGQVRRRTCCLAITLPQPRICTDCCYQPQPG
ncbi:hypothetical protein [Actinoplanes sp. URMC 104]|uniref:hypothetical protein n=1 Tax=Actinoplanes sp. URMC 104 TaxID=3423409 RepID=UPI003F1BDAEB